VQRTRHGRTAETRYGVGEAGVANPRARQRALVVGVTPEAADGDPLVELKELLRTAGVATAGELIQRRERPDPDRYLGRGKLRELKRETAAQGANLVACDDELAPRQERNLETALGVPVIDRTAVILDIFADHAQSAEGKLQVELAQLEYNLARMRGLWTHLERLGAGIGTRGPGESQIETDRRLARDRIATLRRRLGRLERNRALMRATREQASLPTVALAGYTNAGKSTLLNALTGAEVGVGERLFHTLDPTTRAFEHNGRRYLMTDTVGFIRKLPHQLVEAFKATLEETVLADLIVHVVDAAEPAEQRGESIAAVDDVLEEIGAGSKPRLLAYNKVDLLDDDERREMLVGQAEPIPISARTGEGLEELRDRVEALFEETLEPVELLVPYEAGGRLSELHRIAGDLEREDRAEGVLVKARIPGALSHRFTEFAVNGRGGGGGRSRRRD
jgi:GTPase